MSDPRSSPRAVISAPGTDRHRPAVVAVLVFAAGICLENWCHLPTGFWLLATSGALISSLFCCSLAARARSRPFSDHPRAAGRMASLAVLLLLASTGGLRQDVTSNWPAESDTRILGSQQPELVRLRGIVASPIEVLESPFGPQIPSWMETDRSTSVLQCQSLQQGNQWIPLQGLVRMDVSGHLVHVRVGDQIEVIGALSQPRPPANPGSMDFTRYLHRQGIGSLFQVEHPAAVYKLKTLNTFRWQLARFRETMRKECQQLLFRVLDREQCGLASSLLIGDRTMLSDELQDRFAQTGTMHLLAISGLHVAILIGMVLAICRILQCSSWETALVLLLILGTYVFITDLRPPVLRAGILATVAIVGVALGNQIDQLNVLAFSALLLLIAHPPDLFDIGAQLSFLAVGAILWAGNWTVSVEPNPEQSLADQLNEQIPWRRFLKRTKKVLGDLFLTTLAVNLVTLPITMATFHLIAPIGVLLNILLIPFIGVVLGLGYLLLIGGLILPALSGILAAPFRWSLSLLQEAVAWGQSVSGGHLYVPDIPDWWLAVFYLLMLPTWNLVGGRPAARIGFRSLMCWSVLGLLLPFLPSGQESLRCTFLSVGHGLATLIEFPDGKTLLYDAGTIGNGERAERAVLQLLWSRGKSRLDGIVVSHADHDHYSGIFGLIEKIPVGQLFLTRQFLDLRQPGVSSLCALAEAHQIPVHLLKKDDELRMHTSRQPAPDIHVLSPPGEAFYQTDNAASLVLLIMYAGKRILLTGDLEQEGLTDLLTGPPPPVDVLLSPHHGGKVANVLSLYNWAAPRYAVVSSSEQTLPHLRGIPANCTLLNTATSGAITVEISPDGTLKLLEQRGAPGH